MNKKNRIPLIACNLYCILEKKEDAADLVQALKSNNINASYKEPKFEKEFDVKITNIPLSEYWDLDDAMELMFSQIHAIMKLLQKVRQSLNCSYIVDIECHKYELYPGLVICGKSMEYIRLLESDISIDMYDDLQ